MADLAACKDVLDVVQSSKAGQERDKSFLVSGDGFSSISPIDLVKDSGQIDGGKSTKTVSFGSVGRGKEQYRFGPSDLQKLYYDLSEEQQCLIRGIGLGGVEWINKMIHTDLNHSAWLMLNVMPDDRALRIGPADCDIVHITESAAANITGNRIGGSSTIPVSEGVVMDGDIKVVRSILKLPELSEEISVLELVALLLGDNKKLLKSNCDDAARTQRAFAMLYLSIALGPGEKKVCLNRSSYMMVIMHADLTDVNWGKYAIDEIVTGARKLNRDNPLLNITLHGCPAILEILYFDSVDTGFIQLDKKVFPRIKHYNRMILHALVKANNKVEGGRITFGLMKVKDSSKFSINVAAEEMKDSSVKGRNWIFEELAQQAEGRIERSMKLHEDLTSDTGLTEDRKIKLMQTHRSVEKFMLTIATDKVLRFVQKHEVEGGLLLNETVSSLDQVFCPGVHEQ